MIEKWLSNRWLFYLAALAALPHELCHWIPAKLLGLEPKLKPFCVRHKRGSRRDGIYVTLFPFLLSPIWVGFSIWMWGELGSDWFSRMFAIGCAGWAIIWVWGCYDDLKDVWRVLRNQPQTTPRPATVFIDWPN